MKARRLALGILPVLLSACAADSLSTPEASPASPPPTLDPNDAYGDAGRPVPGGAKIVPVDELYARMKEGRPDFLTAIQMTALDARADAERIDDDVTLANYVGLEADPSIAALIAATPALDARLHERRDGSLELSVTGTDGTTAPVTTFGRPTRRHMMAEVLREGARRETRAQLYDAMASTLSAFTSDPLPTAGDLSDAMLEERITFLSRLGFDMASTAQLQSGVALEACGGEFDGSGVSNETPAVHSAAGLYAKVSWPHKGSTTCVRDQGARGTCSAFAVASALERKSVVAAGPRLDISEQHLYARYVSQFGDWRSDGAIPSAMVHELSSVDFKVPVEADWRYNPAWKRTATMTQPFLGACTGYAGPCSETSHEEPVSCTTAQGKTFCWWTSIKVTHSEGIGFQRDPWRPEIHTGRNYSALDRTQSLSLAATILALGNREVVISFTIGTAFDAASKDPTGFVTGPTGGDRGGHAVHAVGWIANSQLPPTVAPANGGGYFVVKNSWGRARADQGYYYVPFGWMVANLLDVVVL